MEQKSITCLRLLNVIIVTNKRLNLTTKNGFNILGRSLCIKHALQVNVYIPMCNIYDYICI